MASSTPRIIKKYPNRRLYDTERSRYITLSDLRKLIIDGDEFEVRDANSKQDLTRAILLQIITDQESGGKPLFTTDILQKMIRFYGGGAQDVFSEYLSRSLELFVEQQRGYQSGLADMISGNPMGVWSEIARKNFQIWQDVQERVMKSSGLADKGDAPAKK